MLFPAKIQETGSKIPIAVLVKFIFGIGSNRYNQKTKTTYLHFV